jgi:hypothetical protein
VIIREVNEVSSREKIATKISSACEDLKCDWKASFMCNTWSMWFSETITVPAFELWYQERTSVCVNQRWRCIKCN